MGGQLVTWAARGAAFYDIKACPGVVKTAFEEIFAVSGLRCRPRLAWLASAHGVGGFAASDLVAIGESDLTGLVERAWSGYFTQLPRHMIPFYQATLPNAKLATRNELTVAFVRFLVAHELGHIRQAERAITGRQADLEADADQFAGWIARTLGWDARLDRIIAHSIGCNESFCSHPNSALRVASYSRGRTMRARQEMRDAPTAW